MQKKNSVYNTRTVNFNVVFLTFAKFKKGQNVFIYNIINELNALSWCVALTLRAIGCHEAPSSMSNTRTLVHQVLHCSFQFSHLFSGLFVLRFIRFDSMIYFIQFGAVAASYSTTARHSTNIILFLFSYRALGCAAFNQGQCWAFVYV